MKRILLTILAGIVLGAGPAGAATSALATTIKPSAVVYPKRDGYKDSIFIEFRTGTRCARSATTSIRNTSTGEVVFSKTESHTKDECWVGAGFRWWGTYGPWDAGKHVPYGEYRVTFRVLLWSGVRLVDTRLVYVRRG